MGKRERGTGRCHFLRPPSAQLVGCFQEPVLTLSIYCASIAHSALTFVSGLIPPNTASASGIPSKQLLPQLGEELALHTSILAIVKLVIAGSQAEGLSHPTSTVARTLQSCSARWTWNKPCKLIQPQ